MQIKSTYYGLDDFKEPWLYNKDNFPSTVEYLCINSKATLILSSGTNIQIMYYLNKLCPQNAYSILSDIPENLNTSLQLPLFIVQQTEEENNELGESLKNNPYLSRLSLISKRSFHGNSYGDIVIKKYE